MKDWEDLKENDLFFYKFDTDYYFAIVNSSGFFENYISITDIFLLDFKNIKPSNTPINISFDDIKLMDILYVGKNDIPKDLENNYDFLMNKLREHLPELLI